MVKALLISAFLIVLVVFIYFIWLKFYRKKMEIRIYHLLLEGYLGKSFESITSIIKKDSFETTFENGTGIGDNYKYLFTHSRNQKTIKVFQFLDNICTGFYIHSNEDRYSLPYWKYVNRYMHNYTESSNIIPTDNELLELAMFTGLQFTEPYEDTEEYLDLEVSDNFCFKNYYKIGENRYLSINAEIPGDTSYKRKTLYSYLCSGHPSHMITFRKKLFDKPDFIFPFLTPGQKTEINIQEKKDHIHQTTGDRSIMRKTMLK